MIFCLYRSSSTPLSLLFRLELVLAQFKFEDQACKLSGLFHVDKIILAMKGSIQLDFNADEQSYSHRKGFFFLQKSFALHLVFIVRASNKSALGATENFLKEIERLRKLLTQVSLQRHEVDVELVVFAAT